MKPWADSTHPSYLGKKVCRCLGCGEKTARSAWGPWCYACNVKRMARLNESMAALARSIGDEEIAKRLEESD